MVRDLLTNLEGLEEISLYYLDGIENTALLFGAGLSKVPEESAGKIRRQEGRDLGARMANAFTAAFREGRERVLLIGSDIPQLYTDLIDEFFHRLEEYPLVIGPAADGGYYLIGFRRDSFQPAVLEGIDWSTNRVYSQTLRRAEAAGLSVFTGKTLRDIDTLSDLDSLLRDKKTRERLPGLAGLFDT